MRHNNANNMTHPTPYYTLHFQIFDKIDSFSEKCVKCLWKQKKEDYIIEEPLNLHTIVG